MYYYMQIFVKIGNKIKRIYLIFYNFSKTFQIYFKMFLKFKNIF